jgi:murein DD-endopeptidase MepM/ murein hydrolase activator NlpD
MKKTHYYILWAIIGIVTSLLVISIAWVQYAKSKIKKIMETTKFVNPTAQKYRISTPFGWVASQNRNHNGIDIACPSGTPVLSSADGSVKQVWNDTANGGGLSITVEHDDGYRTGYAHLSRQDVKAGDKVTMGQQIALSGNTGGHTTGAHLHFTLRYNGVAIDPQQFFYK